MVGRLVEQQQFGLVQQQLAERDAAPLAAGELGHFGIVRRTAQRVHREVDLGVEVPQILAVDLVLQLRHLVGGLVGIVRRDLVVAVDQRLLGGDALHHVLAHALRLVELRLLLQVADARALRDPALAHVVGVDAGHDAQQRRLARAVDAEHADLGVRIEGEIDVLEHLAVARIGLGQTLHVIDELTGHALPRSKCRECGADVASARTKSKGGVRPCCRSPRVLLDRGQTERTNRSMQPKCRFTAHSRQCHSACAGIGRSFPGAPPSRRVRRRPWHCRTVGAAASPVAYSTA